MPEAITGLDGHTRREHEDWYYTTVSQSKRVRLKAILNVTPPNIEWWDDLDIRGQPPILDFLFSFMLNAASEVIRGMDEWHGKQAGLSPDTLVLTLPVQKPNVTVPVIELFMK